jgi:hypothetical protein
MREAGQIQPVIPGVAALSKEYHTPMHRAEFDAVTRQLVSGFTPERRYLFQRLMHAYHNENAARICLQRDEATARKRAREEEEGATTKRLRKSDETMLWDLRSVMKARGVYDGDIEHFLAHNPDRSLIFDTA